MTQAGAALALRHHRQLTVLLTGTLLLFGAFRPARSQHSYPDCFSDIACQSLYDAARQQSNVENLPEALRLYRLAFKAKPDPRLLFSIARIYHRRGETAPAASYYQRFLDSAFDDAEQKKKAREYLAQIQSDPRSVESSSPNQKVPFYKKWWFWTLVGAAGAAVVVGTAVGVSARQPDLSGVMQYRLMP